MSNAKLKIIALICMLLDHIWAFIPNVPYFFHWIGRISAPIFIFCCVLGFEHTANKKIYIMRLYLFSVFMGILNLILPLEMNFIKTLSIITIILAIIFLLEQKHKYSKLCLITFAIWQVITSIVIFMSTSINYEWKVLIATVLGNILYLDGGVIFIAIGVLMYLYRNDKKKLSLSFVIIIMLYLVLYDTDLIYRAMKFIERSEFISYRLPDSEMKFFIVKALLGFHPAFNSTDIIYDDPQWMMIFSLPFILSYNGQRGKNLKYLFYIFYPMHIVILYIIGTHLIA